MNIRTSLLTLGILVMAFDSANAQPFDHLQCFKIRDTLRRGSATADLVPERQPPAPAGCKIKLPATMYCTSTAKENLDPPPVAAVGGGHPGDFFCYNVRCPRRPHTSSSAQDQLGQRTFTLGSSQLLCMPVAPPSSPTPIPTATPKLSRLEVYPRVTEKFLGSFQTFTTTAVFSDGSVRDDFAQYVTFVSSDPAVAHAANDPTNPGRVDAVGIGEASISAVHPYSGISSATSGDDGIMVVFPEPTPTATP